MKKNLFFVTAIAIISFLMSFTAAYAAEIEPDSVVFSNKQGKQIYTIEEGELTASFTVTPDKTYAGARLITVVYNGGRISDVDYKIIGLETGTQTIKSDALTVENAEGATLKAMLWDDTFKPIMKPLTLSSRSCETRITAFNVEGATAVDINQEDKLITVEYAQLQSNEPYPSLLDVKPSITVAANGTVSPASGEAVNLSLKTPLSYTVTAEDGSSTTYSVIAENTVIRCQTAFDGTYTPGESSSTTQNGAVILGSGTISLAKGASSTLETTTTAPGADGNQVLHFIDKQTTTSYPTIFFGDYTAGVQPVKFSMEFKMYIDNLPSGKSTPLYVLLGKKVKQLTFATSSAYTGPLGDYDFGFCLADGSPTSDGKTCVYKGNFDKWYTIKYVLEQRDGKVYSSLYIDGEFVAQQDAVQEGWILQGSPICRINCGSDTIDTEFYLDDYRLTIQATEPLRKVNLIGDSITWSYSESYVNQQGWGHYFGNIFDASKAVYNNFAYPGWDTETYLNPTDETKPTWAQVMAQTVDGDYVVIALGANDCYRARSETDFKANLKTLIDDTKAKGAIPVLVTPHVTAEAYAENSISNHFGTYAGYIRDVAANESVTCLDLNTEMLSDLNSKISDGTYTLDTLRTAYYSCKDGNDFVHLNPTGAQYVCDMVKALLRAETGCSLIEFLSAE